MFDFREEDIKLFASGKLEWAIPIMTLRRNCGALEEYKGSGIIRQNPDRGIDFVMFCSKDGHKEVFKYSSKSGEYFKNDEYYVLTAERDNGDTWECDQVLPQNHSLLNHPMAIARGSIYELRLRKKSPLPPGILTDGFHATMIFRRKFDRFPWNKFVEIKSAIDGRIQSELHHRSATGFSCMWLFIFNSTSGWHWNTDWY